MKGDMAFTLEAEVAGQGVPRECGNCAHYRPHVNPETGRVCPAKEGQCAWVMPKVEFPMSWHDVRGLCATRRIWKWTRAEDCKCWVEK